MDTSFLFPVFQVLVLVFSVVVHEVSHGFAAEELGDDTARRAGRLTLNPIKHLDPFGSVILPFLLSLVPGGVVFGWAKPVPFDPRRLKDPRRGSMLIALAGPLSNLALAGIFAIAVRLIVYFQVVELVPAIAFLKIIIVINIVLAVFNLVPIPPLDGSKILFFFLPRKTEGLQMLFERYGFIILLAFIFFGFEIIHPVMEAIYRFLVGV